MTARTILAAGALACALSPLPSVQAGRPVDLEAADCSRFQSSWSHLQVATATQRTSVPLAAGTLRVEPPGNGGIRVEQGSGDSYAITMCVSAAATSMGDAQSAADAVRLAVEGNRVTVTGTEAVRNGSVQVIVEAPPDARIQASTTNGPIALEDVSGTFDAEASNGPVTLRNVRGAVTASTQNGPIDIRGGSGQFEARTSNGPISVALEGGRWDGTLEARAGNGPLTMSVPEGFASGVEVTSSGRSPWSCRRAECQGGFADTGEWDAPRSVRLGSGPVAVRVSTENGPVTIH